MQNCSPDADSANQGQSSYLEQIEKLLAELDEDEQERVIALATGYTSALSNGEPFAPNRR